MKSPLLRAAVIGLAAGLMIGAFALVFAALTGLGLSCGDLPAEECLLLQESASDMARDQTIAALGLAFASVGALLLLRKPATPPTPTSR